MSSILVRIGADVLAFLKEAGKVVEPIVMSEVQAAVAAAKGTQLGTLAQSLIQIFDSHSNMTGEQKMASVIGALIPAVTATIAGGGLPAIEGQVADFVREFAQSSFNDLKANLAKAAANALANASTDLKQAA